MLLPTESWNSAVVVSDFPRPLVLFSGFPCVYNVRDSFSQFIFSSTNNPAQCWSSPVLYLQSLLSLSAGSSGEAEQESKERCNYNKL